MHARGLSLSLPARNPIELPTEECEAALLAKGIAGETERGRSQRLDAVWSGEPLGICKAHPTKGAVCPEAWPSCIENNNEGAAGGP